MSDSNSGGYARLNGPTALAIRRGDRSIWTIVRHASMPQQGLPLGLELTLSQQDDERRFDPQAEPRTIRRGLPTPPGLPAAGGAAVLVLTYVLAGLAAWRVERAGAPEAFSSLLDLAAGMAAAVAAYVLGCFVEASLVAAEVRGNTGLWGLRRGLPGVERVVWRLGASAEAAGFALAIPAAWAVTAALALPLSPPALLGVITGSLGYLLAAAIPLRPGPGARVLGDIARLPDLAQALREALVRRFLAVRWQERGGGWAMALSALMVALWAVAVGATLRLLASPDVAGSTAAAALWRVLVGVVGVVIVIRMVMGAMTLLRAAATLREGVPAQVITPPPQLVAYWNDHNALFHHVPRLRDAQWQWLQRDAGQALIRLGDTDRTFYWLAAGRVDVIGRSEAGDPVRWAALGPGSGIGEIALIEGRPRTADVIVRERAVVAALDAKAFDAIADDDLRQRFRDVVRASQALARAAVFAGLSGGDRERWIAAGRLCRYRNGEPILRQGDTDRWVGMIAAGAASVRRDDREVAVLQSDTVFGEIAYLAGGTRTATLVAQGDTLVWRWDPDWLDAELDRAGVREALAALARARLNAS